MPIWVSSGRPELCGPKKRQRPRTLCEVGHGELRRAVEKMCRELNILPAVAGRYDLRALCEQERQKEWDRRLLLLEA